MSNVKRLYRSRKERMIAGVAGGLGEYVNIDPTIVRLVFALTGIFYPPIIILYLVLLLVVPEEPLSEAPPPPPREPPAA
jgi:phage shock protein C